MSSYIATAVETVRDEAVPVTGDEGWLDRLIEVLGDAHLVLLGEATHGTHEFYALRARITRRLIHERGFRAVAVEADWPDAYRARLPRQFDVVIHIENSRAVAPLERTPGWERGELPETYPFGV